MGDRIIHYRSAHPVPWAFAIFASTVLAILTMVPARAIADDATLPTPAEMHQLFDAGQYQALLAKLPKVQSLHGQAGQPYDQVDLAILKTNTFIAMKQHDPAVRAINEAMKQITPQTTPAEADAARSLKTLLKYSPALTYTPKTGAAAATSKSLSIDVPSRPAAYEALLADLQGDADDKTKAAKAGQALPPIAAAIDRLNETCPVERVVKSADDDNQKTIDELSKQAQKLMTDALKTLADRANAIADDANHDDVTRVQNLDGSWSTFHHTHGLMTPQAKELKQIAATAGQIQAASQSFAENAPRQVDAFKAIYTSADETIFHATGTLKKFRQLG